MGQVCGIQVQRASLYRAKGKNVWALVLPICVHRKRFAGLTCTALMWVQHGYSSSKVDPKQRLGASDNCVVVPGNKEEGSGSKMEQEEYPGSL